MARKSPRFRYLGTPPDDVNNDENLQGHFSSREDYALKATGFGFEQAVCTGGDSVSTYTDSTTGFEMKLHTFNNSGNFAITSLGNVTEFEVVIVGGGGGGGGRSGGGGGAGGMVDTTDSNFVAGTYAITVGGGGGETSVGGGELESICCCLIFVECLDGVGIGCVGVGTRCRVE